ncbi:vomeronasal type-2 receptor 26-like isoform X2 [Hemicordylus capensis]|uniref:vomeronasal type-2 receptor 26-like isoform X2 n=1 Tax=Hemicordylus capensis TaxID=884348 RepID=UPI0023027DB4|nr:vomeronasal type-2 receptor 26-like isoform X2 [Hemicordylus capensis]
MVSQNIMPDPPINFEEHPNQSLAFDHMVVTKHYQHLLALAFAVKEINENHQILPNITLGFHIYDSYFKPRWTYQTTMELLSTQNRFIPNYQCGIQNKMGSVIGGLYSEISLCMATILGIYKVPQFTYGSVPVHNERAEPLSFYQMVPNESHVYAGFLRLLLHFRWTWVGVFAKDDDNGERFVRTILEMFLKRDICLAFLERVKANQVNSLFDEFEWLQRTHHGVMNSSANAVIFYGESMTMLRWLLFIPNLIGLTTKPKGKVWLMTAQMELTSLMYQRGWDIQTIHGALSFTIHSGELPGFQNFLQMRSPFLSKEDGFLKDFWEQAFGCIFPNPMANNNAEETCTGEEKLKDIPGDFFEMRITGQSYSIYNAAYAVAHALHAMLSQGTKIQAMMNIGRLNLQHHQPWQLPPWLLQEKAGGEGFLLLRLHPVSRREDFKPTGVVTKHYQHLLALAFAVKEINENHQILPNFTLGFHIYDSYFKPRWTYRATMELLSTQNQFTPNYQCGIQNKMRSVIGGLYSEISLYMATILGIYKLPQESYVERMVCPMDGGSLL